MSCDLCGKDGHDRSIHVPGMNQPKIGSSLVCPHCQKAGGVTVKTEKRKVGISGGKATGAILTGGLSLLGTGLSRKQTVKACRCSNCGMSWVVAA